MLTKRSHLVEELDNLESTGKNLTQTLDGLSKINRWLGNTKHTLKAVQKECEKNDIKTIVDLGCGGGDNLIAIAHWLSKHHKKVQLIGIDGNQNVLDYAQKKSKFQIEFQQADLLHPNFVLPECDLLISSHFIYHFKDEELVSFVRNAKPKVRKAMIFSELKRSPKAYTLFGFFGSFFGGSIRSDGLKAIQRSFTIDEISQLIEDAGIPNAMIQSKPWFRYLVTIQLAHES